MSDLAWLFVAMAAVWVVVGAYLVSLALRQRRLEERLRSLTDTSEGRDADTALRKGTKSG